MTSGGVHQFVPVLHAADAVGQHTLALQALLRNGGVRSEIYVERDDTATSDRTLPASSYVPSADDVLVYQLATASDLAPWLAGLPGRLVVNYHNVTPPELVAAWDNSLARLHVRALAELRLLGTTATLGIADSRFNEADMEKAGYRTTMVAAPMVPLLSSATGEAAGAPPAGAPPATRRAEDGGARWLSVGRLAPNKAIEDVLGALYVYRARHDPRATLLVVGRPALAAYGTALEHYRATLGLEDAVTFTGRASEEALRRAYASADVLVVASDHEGFCLPLVEAMSLGVPVVAHAATGVAEVLGDGGVAVSPKSPERLAAAVAGLLADEAGRVAVVERGRRRVAALDLPASGRRILDALLALRG
jgi:glycosyltransferase involved in cell wall biosynthesis